MKRSYTYLKGLLTLALAAFTGWMWAADPVATWTDMSTATSGDYTLNENGNTISDGVLTIGSKPSYISGTVWNPRELGKALVLAMRVTNLDPTKVSALVSLQLGTATNQLGLMTDGEGGMDAMWASNIRGGQNTLSTKLSTTATEYLIVFKYSDYGTEAWAIGDDGVFAKLTNDTACKGGTNEAGGDIRIGALYGAGSPATGLQIHSMTLWNTNEGIEDVIAACATEEMKTNRAFVENGTGAQYTATVAENVNLSEIVWTKVADDTTVTTANLPNGAKLKIDASNNPVITNDVVFANKLIYTANPLTVTAVITPNTNDYGAIIPGIVSNPSYEIFPAGLFVGPGAVTYTATLNASAGYEVVVAGNRATLKTVDSATLGIPSFGVNFYNGDAAKVASTEAQGAYPIKGAAWTDVQGQSSTTVTSFKLADAAGNITDNTTMSLERTAGARQWGLDNMPSSALLKGYIDDSNGNPTTLTFSNIPYAQYRVIVYMSTDTANYNFAPVSIGGISYASAAGNTATATVMSTSDWGHTGPQHNANALAEGVNYLVSPMMTSDSCVISTVRKANLRATIAAVQFIDCTAANRTMTLPGQEITLDANTKISDIDLTATEVLITVKPGVTLTFDEAVTLASLRVIAEGTAESPVKFDATVANPFANIDSVSLEGTAVELVADIYVDAKPSKTALDVIAIASNAAATAEAPQEVASTIAIASGKTLKTKGYLNFTAANSIAGTLEVVSGETTFNLAQTGLNGTVKVATGATFKNGTNDGPNYNGAPKFDIAGTLEVTGTARWSLGANATTTLREGAVLKGAGGTGYDYAYDYFNGTTINVEGNATIEGNIGVHSPGETGKIVFNIAEGKTLTLKGKYDGAVYSGQPTPSLQVTGTGTLKLENANTYAGTTVDAGAKVLVANASALPGAITNNGTITYTVDATPTNTLSGEGVTGVDAATLNMLSANLEDYTGTFAVANNGTLILPAGKEEGVTVAAGSTLKLNLTDDQLKAPYENKATVDGGSIVLTKNNGADEITEGVDGGNYTPATAAVYTVTDGTWSMTPFANAPVEIDFGETTEQSVNLAEILGEVTTIKSLTVKGTNGGALASSGVTIPWTDIQTAVTVDSYTNQFGAITIYPDASLMVQPGANQIYNVTGKTPEEGQARPKLIVKATAACGLTDNEATSISNVDFEVAEGSALFYVRSQKIGEGVALIANGSVALEGTANTLNLVGLTGSGTFQASNNWDGHAFNVKVTLPAGAENTYNGVLSQFDNEANRAVSLTVSGAGKLTLAGANTYTGGTTIDNGATLVAASATALGTGNVTNSGTLELNAADTEATLAQVISGTGAVNVKAGTWALTAANGIHANVTVDAGATLDVSAEGATLYTTAEYVNGPVLTVYGTLKTRHWEYGQSLGNLKHNNGALIVDGGTVVMTEDMESARVVQIRNNVTFNIAEGKTFTPTAQITGDGNLTINGGTLKLKLTDSFGANSNATVTVNSTLTVDGEAATFFRTVLGEGKIVIPEGTKLAIGEATGHTGETSGLSRFAGTLEIAGTFDARSWAGGSREYILGACNIVMQGGRIEKYNGSDPAKIVIASGKTLSGEGTINIPVTLADGATLAGAVTVTGDVTVAGALTITHATKADDVVITCNNAADIVASLPTAPATLKYEIVGGNTIKLAVAKVNVTIPAAPTNTKWYDADGNVVEAGTIAVDPNEDVTLTLKADEGYVFADGTTEKEVTVNAGENGATITIPEVETAEAKAMIGETPYLTFAAAFAAAEEGDTITLLAGVTINSRLDIAQNVTIDLNGQTIAETMEDQFGAIYVKKGATLTIEATNGGEITTDGGIVIGNYGTVVVNGGTIAAGEEPEADVSIYNFYYQADWYGTTTINGGTVARIWNCGVATLAGGEVTDVDNSGAMTIDGSTVTNVILRDGSDAAGVEGAGTLKAAADLTVTTEEGYKAVYDSATGTWTAIDPSIGKAAKIGDEYYTTLAAALEDAKANDTITLLADVTASEIITIEKVITLDGNGKTLTSTAGRAINVDCAGAVTIKNLTIDAGERAINIINQAATVTINGVTATADNVAVMIATTAGAAEVSIDGCKFTGLMVVAVYGAGADVTIANSTIANVDANDDENYGAITVGDTAIGATVDVTNTTITKMGDSKQAYNFIPGLATITGVDEVGCVVAMIGEAGYDTIEEAAGDVKAGQTIVLVTDVTATKALAIAGTLDLNGKTFTGDCLGTVKVNGGMYVTSQGYKMVGPTAEYYQSSDAVFTMVDIQGSITLNAGTLTVVPAVWWTGADQTLTIDQGATFVIPAGKQMNVLCDVIANGTLTIEGTANLYSADATIKAPEGLNVVTSVAGCEVKYADGKYTVVESIVIEDVIAATPAAEAIKDAMEAAGVTEIESYIITTKGAPDTGAEADEVAAVLEVFEVTPTVDANGVLSVAYEFGISAMTNVGDTVTITAGVTGAEYRAGVEVVFYADGAEIGKATTTADSTTVSITNIDAEEINGKKITVKAATK